MDEQNLSTNELDEIYELIIEFVEYPRTCHCGAEHIVINFNNDYIELELEKKNDDSWWFAVSNLQAFNYQYEVDGYIIKGLSIEEISIYVINKILECF